MLLDFRIDFGYSYLYSRKHYHPSFIWDGSIECENGSILNTYKLDYPYIWFGPGHTAKETELPSPVWQFKTKREFTGVRIVADVNENTVFHLHTATFVCNFTADELISNGRLDYSVGPKYINASVIITKKDYLWFRRPLKSKEVEFLPEQFSLPIHNFARMKLAWLAPGECATWEYEVQKPKKDYFETLLHIVAMATPEYDGGQEKQVHGYIPLSLYCDGELIITFERYYRMHDKYMQLLEDDWQRISVMPGKHIFSLKNEASELCLAISRITMKPCECMHGELSIPEWALRDERIVGKVFSVKDEKITVNELDITVNAKPGWNEFTFSISTPGINTLSTETSSANIEIFDVEEEERPIKVGYDMTTVPHDSTGYMDWLLDYTARTRLGNYVVFRNFCSHQPTNEEWERFGRFCKDHGIYVSSCSEESYDALVRSSGDAFSDCGSHEYTGMVYARDPKEIYKSETMKEASEKFRQYIKVKVDEIHTHAPSAAFGDASGGIRYSFLEGVDMVRAETMVPHTMALLSQARPASESLGNGRWGVHIAIQHAHQPYHETHLGQYFLSLMQPWVMGAEVIYEEDSLFNLFKEERQSWDDLLTGGKRDMTRNFFKFAKTHPRRGKNVRNIAFVEGKYAAPFNGFICGSEQDPHYSVWGAFGNDDPTWGHAQPEKARQLLDVLMPGASTHPLRQKFEKRRFYFSGTPFGDFDCVPIEAKTEYFKNYKLLLNLGWNTAEEEDIFRLMDFVRCGGILLTGLPQFSTHVRRDFLRDMEDLALIRSGNLSEFCGIRVNGRGSEYSGSWNCLSRESVSEPELSSLPSDFVTEDGPLYIADVELCGAEIVAWDSFTSKPMLVRFKLGEGYVYTFTAWAYPGHEQLQSFSAAWISELSKTVTQDVYIEDSSREVFYTVWDDNGIKTVMLLNTDWTTRNNEKEIILVAENKKIPLTVKERKLTIVRLNGTPKIEEFEI